MGIYDRDYYREPQSRYTLRGPRTIVGLLILINVALFLADGLLFAANHELTRSLEVSVGSLSHPLYWWQFLTYGFVHSPTDYWHIIGNMLVLFFFGRDVEGLYGRKEFLRLYLIAVVLAGVAWAAVSKLQGAPETAAAVGASGAISTVVVLFALNFPRRTVYVWFLFPMPAWVFGVLIVLIDMYRGLAVPTTQIAWEAHLAGAAFGLLYYRSGWNITRWTSGWFASARFKPRPKLRVHDPDRKGRKDHDLSEEVDRILEKIHREGEASLTRKERRILETASRQYQKKRQGTDDDSV